MNFFARYKLGEHEAVWAELRALGSSVYEGDLRAEAGAVSVELVNRLKSNLDRLASDLSRLGYEYVTLSEPSPDLSAVKASAYGSAMEALQGHPWMKDQDMGQLMGALSGMLGGLHADTAPEQAESYAGTGRACTPRPSPFGGWSDGKREVERYEKAERPLPLALAQFWTQIGWVDFMGRMKGDAEPRVSWQPVLVLPAVGLLDDYQEWQYDCEDEDGFVIDLTSDASDPNGFAGVSLKQGVDALLESGEWFVDYLRRTTRSAGFGALSRKEMSPELRAVADAWEPF